MPYANSIRFAWASAVAASLFVGGCSSDAPGASCKPEGLPASCPMPIPSWSNEVSQIFMTGCAPCHLPGGVEDSAEDFSTYAGVLRVAGTVEGQISSCAMPPDDAGALSAADRTALLAWFACSAPNN
jgi:hypothetical protein